MSRAKRLVQGQQSEGVCLGLVQVQDQQSEGRCLGQGANSWMDFATAMWYVEVGKQLFVFRAKEDELEFRPPYVLAHDQTAAMYTIRDKIEEFQAQNKEKVEIRGMRESRQGSST